LRMQNPNLLMALTYRPISWERVKVHRTKRAIAPSRGAISETKEHALKRPPAAKLGASRLTDLWAHLGEHNGIGATTACFGSPGALVDLDERLADRARRGTYNRLRSARSCHERRLESGRVSLYITCSGWTLSLSRRND
jgi:hypothetical protein